MGRKMTEERRAKRIEYNRRYRELNKEKCREIAKMYYQENKEKVLERHKKNRKKYYENNKERIYATKVRYRNRISAEKLNAKRVEFNSYIIMRLNLDSSVIHRRAIVRSVIDRYGFYPGMGGSYYENNKHRELLACSNRFKRHKENLTDTYIRHLLTHNSNVLSRGDIPQELIDLYRAKVLLVREKKNIA